LGMAVVVVVILAGTLSTHGIVAGQSGGLNTWFLVSSGVVPFVVFLIAATAELNRPPFDLVEAEQELVGGFHTEYSSIRFALFFLAEFMNVITMSAIMVTLFLGGPAGPIFFGWTWVWPILWFFAKVIALLFMFVWFRATLPRLRYDQLMNLGWKLLIPVILFWLLFISLKELRATNDWNWVAMGAAVVVTAVVGITLMLTALRAGDRAHQRELEDV
jgi:NADH-quinone oxidoreductase subunit H